MTTYFPALRFKNESTCKNASEKKASLWKSLYASIIIYNIPFKHILSCFYSSDSQKCGDKFNFKAYIFLTAFNGHFFYLLSWSLTITWNRHKNIEESKIKGSERASERERNYCVLLKQLMLKHYSLYSYQVHFGQKRWNYNEITTCLFYSHSNK